MNIELIIFDLDGTLVNSIPDLTDALNYAARTNNVNDFEEDYVLQLVGGGISLLIEKAFKIKKSDANFKSFLDDFMFYYKEHSNDRSYLYEDVLEILEHLKTKKLAILSNKRDELTKQVIENFNIYNNFSLVMGAMDNIAKKPSAEPINIILEKLNIKAENAVLVGDSEPDIMCAKNAGIKSIAVTYGYRNKEQLSKLNPDFIIDNIMQLKLLIKE